MLHGYLDDRNDWLPEYFNGDGECRVNVGLTSAPRAWRDCLPDDGGRWTGGGWCGRSTRERPGEAQFA